MTALIADLSSRALMLNATAEGLALYKKLSFVSTGFVRQHQGRLAEAPSCQPRRTFRSARRAGGPCGLVRP